MIETEEQRRWWFATHPEYSWSHRGTRGGRTSRSEKERNEDGVDPRDVDEYVDNALKYEADESVVALLNSVKRNFGTQAEDSDESKESGHTTADGTTNGRDESPHFRKYSNEELRRMGIPTPEEEALVSDPHTFLDVGPYGRFITAPIQSLKSLLRSSARDAILYWKKRDDIFDRTTKGRVPAWSTVAQRYWKNESIKEDAIKKWGAENVERMRNGRAPRRKNVDTGQWESRELHHEPVPRRQGGKEFIEVWPDEHATIDPHRRLKK